MANLIRGFFRRMNRKYPGRHRYFAPWRTQPHTGVMRFSFVSLGRTRRPRSCTKANPAERWRFAVSAPYARLAVCFGKNVFAHICRGLSPGSFPISYHGLKTSCDDFVCHCRRIRSKDHDYLDPRHSKEKFSLLIHHPAPSWDLTAVPLVSNIRCFRPEAVFRHYIAFDVVDYGILDKVIDRIRPTPREHTCDRAYLASQNVS